MFVSAGQIFSLHLNLMRSNLRNLQVFWVWICSGWGWLSWKRWRLSQRWWCVDMFFCRVQAAAAGHDPHNGHPVSFFFLVGSWIIFRLLWQFWEKESHEWKDSFRYCWLMLKWFVVLAPLSNPPMYVLAFHVRNLICLASSCPFVWWSRLDVSSSSFRWSHAMKWKGFRF